MNRQEIVELFAKVMGQTEANLGYLGTTSELNLWAEAILDTQINETTVNDLLNLSMKAHALAAEANVTPERLLELAHSLLTNDDWIERQEGPDEGDAFDRGWRTGRNNMLAQVRRVGPWAVKE